MNSSFDDTLQQSLNALQLDSTNSALTDGQNLDHEIHSSDALAHNYPMEAYQTENFSQENQLYTDSFQNALEPSWSQEVEALLSGSDLSDDSNNLNANNLTVPTFQHHVHYHPPHESFHVPSSYEGELQHVESSEHCTFHSAMDVNVSGSINHNHRWIEPNNSYSGSNDSGNNYSDAPSSGTSSSCTDANGDGQCDSGGSSTDCGDSGSCGSDNN